MPDEDAADGTRRFSQRDTVFCRVRWDPTCPGHGESHRGVEEVRDLAHHGFSEEGAASHSAANTVMGWINAQARPGVPMLPDTPQAPYQPPDWAAFTRRLKHHARMFGASLVGVTRVDPRWVYGTNSQSDAIELPEGMDTAVVIAVAMDHGMIQQSPGYGAAAATRTGYAHMAFVSACVARYLSNLGWASMPCGNDTALSIPLAIDAGLGEAGRNGLLITREFGPRVRLCKVFTTAPLVPDRAVDLRVRETCETCSLCIDACPAEAIASGAMTDRGPTVSNNSGPRKWYMDPEKCHAFWRANGTCCSNCISRCPYNKPPASSAD